MATLSEMFIGGIQKQEGTSLDSSSGAQVGAQLAALQQKRQDDLAQLQQKKQELELAKFEKVGKWMDDWAKMPEGGAKKAFGDKFIPNGIQALGLSEKIHPLNQEAMLKDSKLATGVLAWIRKGGDPVILNDPSTLMEKAPELLKLGAAEEIAAVGGDMQKALGEAHEQSLDRQSQEKRALAAKDAAGTKADDQWGRFNEQRQIDLSKELVKNKIPQIGAMMNKVNAAIPGGIDGWKPGSPLPGIDGINSRKPINNLKGDALKLRQSAEGVKNMIMAQVSGQNVTDGEAVRVMGMLGMAPAYDQQGILKDFLIKGNVSPESFVNGMKQAKDMMDGVMNTYRAGYGTNYDVVMGRLSSGRKDSIIQESGTKPTGPMFTLSNGTSYPVSQLEALGKKNKKNKFYLEYVNGKGK